MNDRPSLDRLASILGICFLLTLGLGAVWFVGYLVAGDLAYRIHSSWFPIAEHEFFLMNYIGLAILKMIAFIFFLVPYLAIKIAQRRAD